MAQSPVKDHIEAALAAVPLATFFVIVADAVHQRGFPTVADHCMRISNQFERGVFRDLGESKRKRHGRKKIPRRP